MIDDIESDNDPRLERYTRVGDGAWLRGQGLFVAEGRFVVERLIDASRFSIESILVTATARRAMAMRLEAVDTSVWVCTQALLNRVTGFNFHRGCLALARRPSPTPIDDWFTRDEVLLALEGVGNPDNVGGLFRTAAAFAAGGILVNSSTADPLYRKSVRTSMGAVLQVPWALAEPWPDRLDRLRAHGYRVAALTPDRSAVPIDRFASAGHRRVVLLLGAEGAGLSAQALAVSDDRVRIPMADPVDSLNVTVAAGIALHALTRKVNLEP